MMDDHITRGISCGFFASCREELQINHNAPKDKNHKVYMIFLMNGFSLVIPWVPFIFMAPFFKQSISNNAKESYDNYSNIVLFCACTQLMNVIGNIFNIFNSKKGKFVVTINRALQFSFICILFLIIVLLCVQHAQWFSCVFWLRVIGILALSFTIGIHQSSLLALVSNFPVNYMNAVLIGQGFAGCLTSIVYLVAVHYNINHALTCFFFFIIPLIGNALSYLTTYTFQASRYFNYFISSVPNKIGEEMEFINPDQLTYGDDATTTVKYASKVKNVEYQKEEAKLILCPNSSEKNPFIEKGESSSVTNTASNKSTTAPIEKSPASSIENIPQSEINQSRREYIQNNTPSITNFLTAFKRAWKELSNIFLIFCFTFTCFPIMTSQVEIFNQTDSIFLFFIPNKYFSCISTFVVFTFCSTFGSFIANFIELPNSKFLFLPCIARYFFYQFFLSCNFRVGSRKGNVVLFENTNIFLAGACLLAASHGYLSSLALKYSTKTVDMASKKMITLLFSFAVNLGILAGLCMSYVVHFLNDYAGLD